MTALLFLGDTISHLARAAVCSIRNPLNFLTTLTRMLQIFESGSAATTAVFAADRGQSDWHNFVSGIPGCLDFSSNTSKSLDCLQAIIDPAEILAGCVAAASQTQFLFPWTPALDGPNGLIPALPSKMLKTGRFSKLPFIAGTNLDEGTHSVPHPHFHVCCPVI
jgi:acetylcholinesterase